MAVPTVIVRIACRAERFDETAKRIAWTVGHPVEPAEQAPGAKIRNLFVHTDLAYCDQDDTILERLGMDIIGKIAGVLSWEVLPSHRLAPMRAEVVESRAHGDIDTQTAEALATLPVPVSLMRRSNGRYVWKWAEATGEANSFVSAVTSVLSRAIASYMAVRGELSDSSHAEHEAGGRRDELEAELIRALLALPAPVAVVRHEDGLYVWQSMDAAGHADTLVTAVRAVFAHVTALYLEARGEVMGVNPSPSVYDAGPQLDH